MLRERKNQIDIWNDNYDGRNYRLYFVVTDDTTKPEKIVLEKWTDTKPEDVKLWEFELVDKAYIDAADAALQAQITEIKTEIETDVSKLMSAEYAVNVPSTPSVGGYDVAYTFSNGADEIKLRGHLVQSSNGETHCVVHMVSGPTGVHKADGYIENGKLVAKAWWDREGYKAHVGDTWTLANEAYTVDKRIENHVKLVDDENRKDHIGSVTFAPDGVGNYELTVRRRDNSEVGRVLLPGVGFRQKDWSYMRPKNDTSGTVAKITPTWLTFSEPQPTLENKTRARLEMTKVGDLLFLHGTYRYADDTATDADKIIISRMMYPYSDDLKFVKGSVHYVGEKTGETFDLAVTDFLRNGSIEITDSLHLIRDPSKVKALYDTLAFEYDFVFFARNWEE